MADLKPRDTITTCLNDITRDETNGVAGLVFVAIDKHGEQIAAQASGTIGLDTKEPMTTETVFWIASCTKVLTVIACLQAVEKQQLALDDHEQVYNLCPELRAVKVLQDDGSLVDKKQDITLRRLLSHTAGFGYEFSNDKLLRYGRPVGFDVFHADMKTILAMPLVNQPGETWEYGINVDWAGIMLERATGVRLNDLIQRDICRPLGLHALSLLPGPEMVAKLAHMHQRWPGNSHIETRDHLYREPLLAANDTDKDRLFHSGGAGGFATPANFVQVLAVLLNNGEHSRTGARILKPETVDLMFENQIPHLPDFARAPSPASKPEITNASQETYPQEGNPPQGWSFAGFSIQEPGASLRGRGTVWWAGIANLFWWCDRENGVAGMIASQIMPFGDLDVINAWSSCESVVYELMMSKTS